MRVDLVDGKLRVDVVDLFEGLDTDTLMRVADSLAVTGQVIDFVAQQILDGWTEMDSHGGRLATASPQPCVALDKAIRNVAKRSSEVAAEEIQRLERALAEERQESEELRQKLHKLHFGMGD